MTKTWKKLFAVICMTSILMTMPGISVLADELWEEEHIVDALMPEDSVESVDSLADSVTDSVDTLKDEYSISRIEKEEVIGVREFQVGEDVTATFDEDTGEMVLYSDGGTLPYDWIETLCQNGIIDKEKITSIRVSESSGIIHVPSIFAMFSNCTGLQSIDFTHFDFSNVTGMRSTFGRCSSLQSIDFTGFDTSNIEDMEGTFAGCSSLQSLDLSGFDTSQVVTMESAFAGCSSLRELDLSSFDTSQVTTMWSMFRDCSSLNNLNLSRFNTSNVKDMAGMFWGCSNLISLDLSGFDTSNVFDMTVMFKDCSSLANLNLDGFNTSNVKYMSQTFLNCNELTNLDLSSFDTSNVTTMFQMFYGCNNLTNLNLSNFDTSCVTDMIGMFAMCNNLAYLDLSNFNTSRVRNMVGTFYNCNSLAVLKTPKMNEMRNVDLPYKMYDSAGTEYITLPILTKSITLTREKPVVTPAPTPAISGFSDVQNPKHAYYKAIYWAADAGITKGYPDGTFGIDRSCTRGEMMMFLWRYAGKPSPKNVSKSPFKDVPKTHTFYKAILWGSQKGITKGYPDGTFGIQRNVSRGECMMFLWRLKGKPAPKAVAKSPFKDVPKTHAFYNAILWGSQKKVTTGYTSGEKKGTFGINENCTRGQIVTFLYRAK